MMRQLTLSFLSEHDVDDDVHVDSVDIALAVDVTALADADGRSVAHQRIPVLGRRGGLMCAGEHIGLFGAGQHQQLVSFSS